MIEMNYCKSCILPNTRPNLVIESDGVCNACKGHDVKTVIDWDQRKLELEAIFSKAQKRSAGYDAIIPVSGGKDSTWQVKVCKDYGLNILAVTWKTPARTELGQRNLNNLIALGVDHMDYTVNPEVEKKFMLETLRMTGSSAVPMHLSIYTIPLKIAVAMDVPLVIWGESPHMEYGGGEKNENLNKLDKNWMKTHGILQGAMAEDWISEKLNRKELESYMLPSDDEMNKKDIQSIFLGYYLPWDPEESLRVSVENGFKVREEGPKCGYYNYADIDCNFISIHHYFKWLKFGFTRLFDNLSLEIRNKRMSRNEALKILSEMGDQKPKEDIDKLIEFLNISHDDFKEIEEKFRNKEIWYLDDGVWKIRNFIIKDWIW